MSRIDLKELKIRLKTLTVFRELLSDTVIKALCGYFDSLDKADTETSVSAYTLFVSELYEANSGNLGQHVKDICNNSGNIYVRTIGRGKTPENHIKQCVKSELDILQEVADLTPGDLREPLQWAGILPEFTSGDVNISESFTHRAENIHKYGYGIYAKNPMFYIDEKGTIVPVRSPDKTHLEDLVDYKSERQIIIDNTKALLSGKPAANILLTGDAGTGKSSSVKAVANALFDEGLRIIEVRKDQLRVIPEVLDELAGNPLKFVLFIDDLSFLTDDDNFNALKAVLEGSVSAKSKNVVIYATSNRRHIIKEKFSDREGDDIHRNDTVQELISLSERFGIHITFQKPNKETFLHIVRHMAREHGLEISDEELELKAERFALERGGRSPRLAKQFIDGLLSDLK